MSTSSRRVGIVGAGGLGGPLATLLHAEHEELELHLWDGDRVELSNLHRQLHFGPEHIGHPKASTLARTLNERSEGPSRVIGHDYRIDQSNADQELEGCDWLVDASDSFQAKFLVNDWLCDHQRTGLIGACQGYHGQVVAIRGGDAACYRCLFEEVPGDAEAPSCATAGVLSPVVGAVAAAMAWTLEGLMRGESLPYAQVWDDFRRPLTARHIELNSRPTCRCVASSTET